MFYSISNYSPVSSIGCGSVEMIITRGHAIEQFNQSISSVNKLIVLTFDKWFRDVVVLWLFSMQWGMGEMSMRWWKKHKRINRWLEKSFGY